MLAQGLWNVNEKLAEMQKTEDLKAREFLELVKCFRDSEEPEEIRHLGED
jgi:hypothetical protein